MEVLAGLTYARINPVGASPDCHYNLWSADVYQVKVSRDGYSDTFVDDVHTHPDKSTCPPAKGQLTVALEPSTDP